MSVYKYRSYKDEKIATHFLALFFTVLNSLVNNNIGFPFFLLSACTPSSLSSPSTIFSLPDQNKLQDSLIN